MRVLGNLAEITRERLDSPEDILRDAKLDPDEWTIRGYKEWDAQAGGGGITRMQSISAERTVESFIRAASPARPEGKLFKPKKQKQGKKPILIGIMPDMHCPHEEPVLCDGFAAWAAEYQPAKIVNIGDGDDASSFGRHPKNPKYDRPAQEGIDGYYHRLRQQREAVPDAEIIVLPGNHDFWLQRRVLESLPAAYGLRRAASEEEVLGIEHLLRLDELGIEYICAEGGEYHEVFYPIVDDLVLMHGNMAGEHGGATKEIKSWEGSVGQGHDHKLAMVAVTRRLPNGTEVQRYAMSFGTASKRSLGYDPRKNVNQGFAVIVLHPDGRWHPEFATYCPQRNDLCWRDFRYSS